MSEIPEDMKDMYESSKLDRTMFVGSQVRCLIGRITALAAERDRLQGQYDTELSANHGCQRELAQVRAERDEFNAGYWSCIADLQKAGKICKATEARLAEVNAELERKTAIWAADEARWKLLEAKWTAENAELRATIGQLRAGLEGIHSEIERSADLEEYNGVLRPNRAMLLSQRISDILAPPTPQAAKEGE